MKFINEIVKDFRILKRTQWKNYQKIKKKKELWKWPTTILNLYCLFKWERKNTLKYLSNFILISIMSAKYGVLLLFLYHYTVLVLLV